MTIPHFGLYFSPCNEKNLQKDGFMNKRKLFVAIVILAIFSVGVIYAQVCYIGPVTVTGVFTNTVTFTNNSDKAELVRVEVVFTNSDGIEGKTQFGVNVPPRSNTGTANRPNWVAGVETRTMPGMIISINECP